MHIVCIHIHTYLYLITTYLYIFIIYISYIHIYIYIYYAYACSPPQQDLPFFLYFIECFIAMSTILPFAVCYTQKKNKKQQIYLFRIWGEPQKTKNTDTHKPKKTTMHLRTYPPLSQFQSMSLKTAYRFYFAKWVSQFFLGFFPPTQNRSPKLLIFLVWG